MRPGRHFVCLSKIAFAVGHSCNFVQFLQRPAHLAVRGDAGVDVTVFLFLFHPTKDGYGAYLLSAEGANPTLRAN